MPKKKYKYKEAHDLTYLIANLFALFVIWVSCSILIWLYLPLDWWANGLLIFIAFWAIAWIEERYLTGVVGYVVTELFPDDKESILMEEETTEALSKESNS